MAPPPLQTSIRDAIVPVAEGQTFFETLRALGVSAIELLLDPQMRSPALKVSDGTCPFRAGDGAGLRSLQQRLADEGVRISAILLMTDFSGDEASAHVDWAVAATNVAAALAAPAVRIDTATRQRDLTPEQVRDYFIERVGEVLRQTKATRVDLGIENHGHHSNDPAFLDAIFAAVGDPRLGMTLDTGNFYWAGHPLEELYGLIARYAPRAKHTHIKNINYPTELANARRPVGLDYGKYCSPLDEGNIDLARVVRILREAGFNRDLCIENESLGKYPPQQRIDVLRRDVQALREAQRQ